MKNRLFFVLFLLLIVEVKAQPKTLYGLKTAKLILGNLSLKAFYMDETPVTYADFKKYVSAGGKKTAYWFYESYNINEQPITGISWHHAADYCNWRSKCEGLSPVYIKTDSLDKNGYPVYKRNYNANGYRFPTSDEFRYAAGNRKFPWGDSFYDTVPFTDYRSNIDIDSGMKSTEWWRLAPVKSQFRNENGLYNMCGNIWHWCDDWTLINDAKRICGGGWGTVDPKEIEYSGNNMCMPGNYNYDLGFRCVRNAEVIESDSVARIDSLVNHVFYEFGFSEIREEITDFYSNEFKNQLKNFIAFNYSGCINFLVKIDEQEIIDAEQMAELIIKVCKRNNINPLFLTTIMISESGFGTVSFPRWYNNPMAFHWQNKLMVNGEPVYESLPGKKNRKYKTLEDGFEAFCKGIRRDLYYKAAKKDLDSFHLIYVGYRADEWMNTMTRIYRDIAGVRFEAKFPIGDAGKYIYTDWETIKKNVK